MSHKSSNKNSQGCSFKGQDLSGADFSEHDLRGADFTNSILRGANFRNAKAGLQMHWKVGLLIFSMFLATISGLFSAFTGAWLGYLFSPEVINEHTILPGVIVLILLSAFFIVIIHHGLETALRIVAFAGALALAGAGVVALAVAVTGTGTLALAIAMAIAGAIAGAVAGVIAVALAVGLAIALGGVVSGVVAGVVAGTIAVVISGVVAESIAVVISGAVSITETVAGTISGTVVFIASYVGWQALSKNRKHTLILKLVIVFTAIGGTSFRKADLTDSNFTKALLKNVDLRRANVTRTYWLQAEGLDYSRISEPSVSNSSVQDLLVTGNGYQKSYLGVDLRGVNLTGANLSYANLKGADISESTLQRACLEWATLTETQAIGTDFTAARLTGACLEAWNIDNTTKLDQIDCRFVYLLQHAKAGTDDRERRPPGTSEFAPGDFTKLYTKVINTVQILLRNGINKEAFAIAFQNLMEENPGIDFDSVQGIEKKDKDFLLTIEVSEEIDKNEVYQDFLEPYNKKIQELQLETEKQAILLDANEKIIAVHQHYNSFFEVVFGGFFSKEILRSLSIPQPSPHTFNLITSATAEGKAMNESTDKSRQINVKGDFNLEQTGSTFNIGDISGAVTNTVQQLKDSDQPDAPQLADLISQLQTAIESDLSLTEEQKKDSLEALATIGEEGQKPPETRVQKLCKFAVNSLKALVPVATTTGALAKVLQEYLPQISTILGL